MKKCLVCTKACQSDTLCGTCQKSFSLKYGDNTAYLPDFVISQFSPFIFNHQSLVKTS